MLYYISLNKLNIHIILYVYLSLYIFIYLEIKTLLFKFNMFAGKCENRLPETGKQELNLSVAVDDLDILIVRLT